MMYIALKLNVLGGGGVLEGFVCSVTFFCPSAYQTRESLVLTAGLGISV